MPTLADITGIEPVVEECNIYMVPLRAGAAAGAVINEATKISEIAAKTDALWRQIVSVMAKANSVPLADAVTGGRMSLNAAAARQFRHRHSGVYVLRVIEHYADYIVRLVSEEGIAVTVKQIKEPSHEIRVPNEMFPAGVAEQAWLQHGLQVNIRTFASESVYEFVAQSASQAALAMKKGLVLTKEATRFEIRPIAQKFKVERAFVYGGGGPGSTERDLGPAWAKAFGVSSDLVKTSEVSEVPRGIGFVGMVSYPYSSERYDAAYELFAKGRFVLYNPSKPHLPPLELYVAQSLLELQAITGLRMVVQGAITNDGADEETAIVDLTPPEADDVSRCVLIPADLHALHRVVAREAALAGRARVRGDLASAGGAARASGARELGGLTAAGAATHAAGAAAVQARALVASRGDPRGLRLLLTPAHLAAAQYLFADLGDDDVSHIGGRGATGRGRGRARWSPAGAEWWAERSMHRMLAWGYDARGLRSGRRK